MFFKQHWHLEREGKYCNCHGCVHEEQHIEEQKTEIAEHFGSIVSDVKVQGTNQEAHQNVSKQSQIHKSL